LDVAEPAVESKSEGWLGEVEGLQISLAGANEKLGQNDRRTSKSGPVVLGMPSLASSD
jgi:hypothetical protein